MRKHPLNCGCGGLAGRCGGMPPWVDRHRGHSVTERDLEEFAGYLRGMKERTGRSYEALAKRAGISSSAIHRYCSGKGLPADFGTVERIAKVCGAHSDELLELHRRWIRAEAAQAWAKAEGAPTVPRDAAGAEPTGSSAGPSAEQEPAATGGEPVEDDPAAPAPPSEEPEKRPAGPARFSSIPFVRRWLTVAVVALSCSGAAAVGTAALMSTTAAAPGPTTPAPSASPEDGRLLLSRACPPIMALGEHDECVRELQRILLKAGGLVQVDADFGPGTLRHVVAFQVLAGMEPNGLVDDATKRMLYQNTVKMIRWSPAKVEGRIREVFPEEPDRAVGIAKCMSFLDQYYSLPNVDGTRNWGVFQISDRRLAELGGSPLRAFDPEWNIQAARRLWSQNRDFSHWENCDQTYRRSESPDPKGGSTSSPAPGKKKPSPSPSPGRDENGR
ncbi:helix-turn-helix domain-containing protein [Streptosporangium sp. NPDC050855]|uniref:helix-turn-helix domain-containing protein n=1 Tax=Streptosporangium sp. NPDC050855 TaxID=3366194 RepID=UPI0037A5F42E